MNVRMLSLFVIGSLAFSTFGCGGRIDEGVPEGIDMTQDYSPAVPTPDITAGQARESQPASP